MNPDSLSKALDLFEKIEGGLLKSKKIEIVMCPPLAYAGILASNPERFSSFGAQDVSKKSLEEKKSFTGEVSARMLKDIGLSYVILGHSERRKMGEMDADINAKLIASIDAKITPILCVGEDSRDEDGAFLSSVKFQLEKCLSGVKKKDLGSIIVAYEPSWAIGGDKSLSPRDIHEMIIFIKKIIVDMHKLKSSDGIRIIYGGSVTPLNASGIAFDGGVDGLLVGHESLVPQNFLNIISIANKS